MHRMPRQFLDLLIALFVPVSRYRCPSIPCGWEGLLRERRQGPTSRDPMGPYPGDYSPKGASLPDAAPGDRPAKPLRQFLRHYR